MKILLALLTTLMIGCGGPKYEAGTCFDFGLAIGEIVEVKENGYLVRVHSFVTSTALRSFELVEKEIEEHNTVAQPCNELLKD